MIKKYSNFNISHLSCLKISKPPLLNSTHGRFFNNTKSVPKFLIIVSFDANKFSMKKLFNIQ